MQEKIIKIPFNRNFFLESHKAIWAFSARKGLKRNIAFTLLAVFLLVINLIIERPGEDPVGTMLAGGYLAYMILFWSGRVERRIGYFKKVKKQALHFAEESMEFTFIFSDNGFEYIDKEKSYKMAWVLFKPLAIYKDNILLFLEDGGVIFSIGKSELGEIEYDELCGILKSKIG